MMISKQTPWRNPRYIKWVKEQPSIISRIQADDPHHIIGHGFGGVGTKAPDWALIPLTRQEHNDLHQSVTAWEDRNGSQLDLMMRFWRENWEEIQEFMK
jgi:hypothetical protein